MWPPPPEQVLWHCNNVTERPPLFLKASIICMTARVLSQVNMNTGYFRQLNIWPMLCEHNSLLLYHQHSGGPFHLS